MDPPPSQPPLGLPSPYPGATPTPPNPYYPPSPPYGASPYPYAQAPPTNGLAISSLVIGIVAIVFCWVPIFDVALSVPAFILGILGVSKANQTGGSGKGLAISGVVLGAIATAVTLLVVILYLTFKTFRPMYGA